MAENYLLIQIVTLVFVLPALWSLSAALRAQTGDIDVSAPVLALAALGPWMWSVLILSGGWHTDFGFSLWVSVSTALVVFTTLAFQVENVRRLAVLVIPYLTILLILGLVMGAGATPAMPIPESWVMAHILVAVATYAMLTLAALAAVAVILKEQALKRRYFSPFFRALPAVADAETWQDRLTLWAWIVLGIGVLSGVAIQAQRGAPLIALDHKTLLTLIAFAVIGLLLALQRWSGLRGRRAARWVMIAYLLITLAYPGVKFISGTLLDGI